MTLQADLAKWQQLIANNLLTNAAWQQYFPTLHARTQASYKECKDKNYEITQISVFHKKNAVTTEEIIRLMDDNAIIFSDSAAFYFEQLDFMTNATDAQLTTLGITGFTADVLNQLAHTTLITSLNALTAENSRKTQARFTAITALMPFAAKLHTTLHNEELPATDAKSVTGHTYDEDSTYATLRTIVQLQWLYSEMMSDSFFSEQDKDHLDPHQLIPTSRINARAGDFKSAFPSTKALHNATLLATHLNNITAIQSPRITSQEADTYNDTQPQKALQKLLANTVQQVQSAEAKTAQTLITIAGTAAQYLRLIHHFVTYAPYNRHLPKLYSTLNNDADSKHARTETSSLTKFDACLEGIATDTHLNNTAHAALTQAIKATLYAALAQQNASYAADVASGFDKRIKHTVQVKGTRTNYDTKQETPCTVERKRYVNAYLANDVSYSPNQDTDDYREAPRLAHDPQRKTLADAIATLNRKIATALLQPDLDEAQITLCTTLIAKTHRILAHLTADARTKKGGEETGKQLDKQALAALLHDLQQLQGQLTNSNELNEALATVILTGAVVVGGAYAWTLLGAPATTAWFIGKLASLTLLGLIPLIGGKKYARLSFTALGKALLITALTAGATTCAFYLWTFATVPATTAWLIAKVASLIGAGGITLLTCTYVANSEKTSGEYEAVSTTEEPLVADNISGPVANQVKPELTTVVDALSVVAGAEISLDA